MRVFVKKRLDTATCDKCKHSYTYHGENEDGDRLCRNTEAKREIDYKCVDYIYDDIWATTESPPPKPKKWCLGAIRVGSG